MEENVKKVEICRDLTTGKGMVLDIEEMEHEKEVKSVLEKVLAELEKEPRTYQGWYKLSSALLDLPKERKNC